MISDGETPAPGKRKKSGGAQPPKGPQNPPALTVLPGGKSTAKNQPGAAPFLASKSHFGPGNPIPLAVRMTVRALYVVQGLKPAQIGPMVHLSATQVQNLVRTSGWSKLRAEKSAQKESKAIALQDARADVDVQRVVDATAMLSEDLSLRSLNLCSELVDKKDAKGLQMASGAARNFVQIARMSRGLDARTNGNGGGGVNQLNVNLFVVQGETPESMARAAAIPCEAKPVSPSQ